MTILQQYGVFSGGVLSKALSGNALLLSPYVVNTSAGVTGSGAVSTGVTKQIAISFGATENDVNIYRDLLEPPKYTIFVGPLAGTAYIYYDNGNEDLGLTYAYPTGQPVFGEVSWPANNGSVVTQVGHPSFGLPMSMSVISLATTGRTEARVAHTENQLTGDKLYYESQRFISGQLNKPLTSTGVLVDVLTAESSIRAGSSFFITLLQPGQVKTDTLAEISSPNMSVLLEPCKHVSRVSSEFVSYDTKLDPAVDPYALVKTYTDPADFQGKYIYVAIHKVTGAPAVIEDPSLIFGSSSSHWAIARSEDKVGASATDLSGVDFTILNNVTSITRSQEDAAIIHQAIEPTGFLVPVRITPMGSDNVVTLEAAQALISGFGVDILSQTVPLSTPPISGTTVDFIWLEMEFTAAPTLVINKSVRVTTGNVSLLTNPMENVQVLNNAAVPANFTYVGNGVYRAPKPENDYRPFTYALPIAVIPRFNSSPFSSLNPNGGVGRPDGRTAPRPSVDEILVIAPTVNRKDSKFLIGKNMQLLLKTELQNALEQANYVSSGATGHYSKRPLQIDFLGSTSAIGTQVGLPNGGRRLWSRNIGQEELMSFRFTSNVDSSHYVGNYNNSGGNQIDITVPAGTSDTEIALDALTGQPKEVLVRWASDGSPVKLMLPWSVGATNQIASVNIDTTDASWTSHQPGAILVQFKVRYTQRSGFTKMPSSIISAQINDSPLNAYFPTNSFLITEKKVREVGSAVTIGSNQYYRSLWEEPVGSSFKYYAAKMKVPYNGNNLINTPYFVSDSFVDGSTTYQFSGVSAVEDQYGNRVEVAEAKWVSVSNQFEIKLAQAMPSGAPVWFVMGVTGKEMDYNPGSSEISNLTEAKIEGSLTYNDSSGILFFQTGKVLYGFSAVSDKSVVWLEDYAVPVSITGLGSNLLRINMNITTAQYNALSVGAQGLFTSNGSGGYRPAGPAVLKFSYLESREEVQPIVLKYLYNASSLVPFDTSVPAEVVDRGYLIQTIDGSGNRPNSVFSPLDSILPVVQGIIATGDGVAAPSPVGINDILIYQQMNTPFLEGTTITLDGSLALNVRVNPPSGLAAWICLVKQESRLLLFVYEVRDGQFILNSDSQAFVTELQDFRRESNAN